MTGFRGHDQGAGSWARKGPISQRDLVRTLGALIDASKAKSGTRTRDEARAALRALLCVANWNTSYVRTNIGLRRLKYLSQLGYPIPYDELRVSDKDKERLERLGGKGNG